MTTAMAAVLGMAVLALVVLAVLRQGPRRPRSADGRTTSGDVSWAYGDGGGADACADGGSDGGGCGGDGGGGGGGGE